MMLELQNAIRGKQHVIWDWNGTLLNDVDHAVSSMNQLLAARRLPMLDVDRYRQIFEFPVISYYQALGFDFAAEPFESLCHKFVLRFMEGFQECPLVPGMLEFLRSVRAQVRCQTILSATDQASLDEMISHFNIKPIFDHVFGIGNKLAESKLDRGRELIALSGISESDTVLVGDTLHDLEVGEALGISVILVTHGHQCATRLKSKHHQVLELSVC